MNVTRVKFLIAGVLLVGAVVFLVSAGLGAGKAYYMDVDEFLADKEYRDKRVRLQGTVAEEDLVTDADTATTTFQLLGKEGSLTVSYKGIPPDLFKAGGQVIVGGRMGDEDVFEATELITQCPSKYTDEYTEGDQQETPE